MLPRLFLVLALGMFLVEPLLSTHAVAQSSKGNPYSIDDLEALAKTGSYRELYSHLKDIPPAKREARWEAVVTKTAEGLLAEETDQGRKARLLDELQKEYPSLKKSKRLATVGNPKDLKDFESCYTAEGDGEFCTRVLREFVHNHKGQSEVQLAAARLVAVKMAPWVALEFYLQAIANGDKGKICADDRLANAVLSGLRQSEGEARTNARQVAGKFCWPQVREAVLDEMNQANAVFLDSACPIALEKKALSGLKEKKCRK